MIAFGTTRYALAEARDRMAARGHGVSSLRLEALPPSDAVRAFIEAHDVAVVLEMNHDAQLFGILAADLPRPRAAPAEHRVPRRGTVHRRLHRRSTAAVPGRRGGLTWTVPKPSAPPTPSAWPRPSTAVSPSTLCKGCGHNSIANQIQQVAYDLALRPHEVLKLSGIGCSSKSPAYFLGMSHGFNSLHGRMPAVATGALLGNHHLRAHRRVGRRRHRLDRLRAVQAHGPPQRADGLPRREQRRVRADQGPVLGDRRRGAGAEVRRA